MKQEELLAYLKGACNGRQHTVRGAELEKALNLNGTDLRKLVNRLRRDGVPVGSSRSGYFYARTAGEVYGTIRQLRGLEAALEKFEEPPEAPAETQRSGFGREGGE